jgi:hypothetical protein
VDCSSDAHTHAEHSSLQPTQDAARVFLLSNCSIAKTMKIQGSDNDVCAEKENNGSSGERKSASPLPKSRISRSTSFQPQVIGGVSCEDSEKKGCFFAWACLN